MTMLAAPLPERLAFRMPQFARLAATGLTADELAAHLGGARIAVVPVRHDS